jgi:hypothetical protein
VIISPQDRVHHGAVAVTGDRVFLVPPENSRRDRPRLAGAWDSIRVRTRSLEAAEAVPVVTEILRARRALPSQWLPSLTARRLTDG